MAMLSHLPELANKRLCYNKPLREQAMQPRKQFTRIKPNHLAKGALFARF